LTYDEIIKEAEKELEGKDAERCPKCSEFTFVLDEHKGSYPAFSDYGFCYACHETHAIGTCHRCGTIVLNDELADGLIPGFCENCQDDIMSEG